MWQDFFIKVREMFKLVNGKKVVIWGYGSSGWFIEHLFKRYNRQVEYIVDDGMVSPKLNVMTSSILNELFSGGYVCTVNFLSIKCCS